MASPPPSAPPTTPATPAAAAAHAPAAPPAPLELELGLPPPETPPPIVSDTADGATRLLATAYIGIGNRLHLRGDGPGLSWEKGVPLQFVSIGKWRWEAPMPATAPFRVKLYKNDTHECTALGELTLDPGRQVEVRAEFG